MKRNIGDDIDYAAEGYEFKPCKTCGNGIYLKKRKSCSFCLMLKKSGKYNDLMWAFEMSNGFDKEEAKKNYGRFVNAIDQIMYLSNLGYSMEEIGKYQDNG